MRDLGPDVLTSGTDSMPSDVTDFVAAGPAAK
jgi:hypothetical protein